MFTNLTLSNFQCHRSLSIPLGKITTLVGPSDSGKTAILRALDWLCFNYGRVVLLQRRGGDYVSVSLDVDGHKVTRSSKNNSYQVDEQLFKTINKTIPPEVSSLLHVSEDNVQRQHDYLFWFTAKGAELVSNLNRVVDLSKLEDWVHIGLDKERVCKKDVEYHTTRKTELEQNISDLSCYKEMDSDLDAVESLYTGLSEKKRKLEDMERTVSSISVIDERTVKCDNYISDLNDLVGIYDKINGKNSIIGQLSELLSRYKKYGELEKRYEELCSIPLNCDEIIEKRERINGLEQTLSRIDVLDSVLDELGSASGLLDECEENRGKALRYKELTDLLVCLGSLDRSIAEKDTEIENVREEIREKSGGVCPICGGALNLESSCG